MPKKLIVNCGEDPNCKCADKTKPCPNPTTFQQKQAHYTARRETLDGQDFLVVPVVMMTEGVHHGSGYPTFYSEEALSQYVGTWNGRPVPIHHPEESGGYVSATMTPQVYEQWNVGTLFNVHFADKALRGEAWINVNKIRQKSPKTYEMLQSGEAMDVSIGVFPDLVPTSGTWNGETYSAVAYNLRPDHLALLPDQRGACSWEDGCGVRVNSENEEAMDEKQFKAYALKNKIRIQDPVVNAMDDGLMQKVNAVRSALYAKDVLEDGPNYKSHYLEDFDAEGALVYSVQTNSGQKYYQTTYSESDGAISINFEDSQEVMPVTKTSYRDINVNAAEEQEDDMPKAIQEEVQTKEQALQALKGFGPLTPEELSGLMSEPQRQLVANMQAFYSESRQALIEELKALGLPEALLTNASVKDLQATKAGVEAKLQTNKEAPAPVDFSGMGAGTAPVTNSEGVAGLPMLIPAIASGK